MENKIGHEEIEKNFITQLSEANLNRDQLSKISKSVAVLQKSGFQVIDWSIFGQPAFERLLVETQLPFERANSFQDLLGVANLKEIFIYRKGIPPISNFYNVKVIIDKE